MPSAGNASFSLRSISAVGADSLHTSCPRCSTFTDFGTSVKASPSPISFSARTAARGCSRGASAAVVSRRSGQPSVRIATKASSARSSGEPRIYFSAFTSVVTLCRYIPS